MRASFLVVVVGILVAGVVPRTATCAPARAAADGDEERLLHEGVDARRQRDDAKALDLFRQAYALHSSARAAAQMGLAEIALGRWPESESHLEEAMSARNEPWIEKNKKSLQEALTRVRQNVGRLEVLGGPAGAEVVIAGEVIGRLPLSKPIRVRVGTVRFEVRAKGYDPETRTVKVDAQELTRETVVLGAEAPISQPPRASTSLALAAHDPTTTPAGMTGIIEHSGEKPPSKPPSSGAALRTTGVVLGALGIAATGAGAVFSFKVRAASNDASSAMQHMPSADINGQRYQTLQWIGYAGGATLLIGGVITYLIGASR